MSNWSEEDLLYAAGFLDGEGCFVVNSRGTVRVAMMNNYRPVVDWFLETFGGTYVKPSKPRKPNHRPTHGWQINGRPAADLCRKIAPYLKEKAEQALLLIALQQTVGRPLVGTKLHPSTVEERAHLGTILKEKKHVAWD